jgi:predicted dehydrogenase
MSKVRMAILGCGGMAGAHAQRYRDNDDVEIVALCDIKEEIVQGYIDKHLKDTRHTPQIFTDPAQMYAEAKPDAVTIVTPHTSHFEHGLQALEAGVHVFMEKPMVTESGQAHELAAAAERAGKIVVIGYNTPCTPAFRWLRDAIRSGELGKLETVTGWQTQNWRKGTIGTWRQNPALSGGGQMYDSGAHMFNSLVWSVEQPVAEVLAFTDNVETPVDINGTVNIRFANGVLATMTIAGNCPASSAGMYYTFDNGRVEVDGWSGSWIKVWKGNEQIEPELKGESTTPNDNFIDAVLGRAEPQTSPINGVIQSELMDAIYESAEKGAIARPKSR